MKPAVGLALIAALMIGCTQLPQPAAEKFRTPTHVLPVAYGNPDSREWTERSGAPLMPWPKFQAGVAARANEAELAIVLRGHELRERHPGASPEELAQMLARDDAWEQHARFVPTTRRTVVVREALVLW